MALQIEALTISPRGGPALFAPLTLTVAPAAVVTVMGPSGVGKSTLLDAIAGHLAQGFVQSGRIWLGGRDLTTLPAEARGIGMMFQDAVMFGHLSVGDNLAFGLTAALRGRASRRAAVEAALQTAGLAGVLQPRSRHAFRRAARACGPDAHPAGRTASAAARRALLSA